MLQPANRGSGLRPTKIVAYGGAALVAVFVASLALHTILGFLSFVFEAAVVLAVVVVVMRVIGFRRR